MDFHYWWKNALQKFIIQDILSFKTCRLFHFTHYLFHLINNFDFIKRVLHQLVKSVVFIAKEKQRKLSIKALACIQHTALTFSSLVCVMVIKTQRNSTKNSEEKQKLTFCLFVACMMASISPTSTLRFFIIFLFVSNQVDIYECEPLNWIVTGDMFTYRWKFIFKASVWDTWWCKEFGFCFWCKRAGNVGFCLVFWK